MPTNLNIVKVTKPQEENKNFIHKNTDEPNEIEQSQTQEEVTENIAEIHIHGANDQAAKRGRLNLNTVDHVEAYPLIQETEEIAKKIAITRIILAQTKPRIDKVIISRPIQTVAPVINFLDKMANSTLNTVERVVPSLKTKTYKRLGEEIALPYTLSKKYGKQFKDTTARNGENYIYQPVHGRLVKFRKYYNEKLIDTKGKPLIRGHLDPVLLPVNNAFEKATVKYFPKGEKVPNDTFSCEFNRGLALDYNFMTRAVSAAGHQVVGIAKLPIAYGYHTNSVYNKNLDKQNDLRIKNVLKGTWDTITDLEHEIWASVTDGSLFRFFGTKSEGDNLPHLVQ
ncbi:Sps4p [Saccharomyces paradoxus]|uniref:Sps4p n=1 Tax=Saccharomyces paradoxus TaxID=27291 RepID=A0A8B8V084_SACPA|nr:Sps4 [Saccharomyces paradoxus]QHS76395.1 Sps4 [Saccharomyces paradoxus]